MLRYASESEHKQFIVGTEVGLLYPMQQANPEKDFFPASEQMLCEDMKKITLEDVLRCIETMQPQVSVPKDTRQSAFGAVQRMLEITR